jgi:Tfp pilus assembly protein PilF
MEAKMQIRLCLVILAMITSGIVFSGCSRKEKIESENQIQNIQQDPDEQQKQRLQNRLNIRYSDADTHFELAQIYRKQMIYDKAEKQYNLALQFAPGHKNAQAAMVKMFLEKNDAQRSKILADIYMNQAKPSAKASMELGKAFENEGLPEYSLQCYQHAVNLAPTSAELHRLIGYHYKRQGDMVRAEEAFKKSFQLDPYNADVSGELGRMGVEVQVPRKQEKI